MGCSIKAVAELNDLTCVFNKVVTTLIPIGGILFFILFLIGGFKYITSAGDPKAVASAHSTLSYAVIGMVLCALSYMALLIISNLTGNTTILNFSIYLPN